MPEPISVAQYFPWDGGAIFVGTGGTFPAHAHQAIQICFLFEGRIRLRTNDEEPWVDYELAIVPSQQRHAMEGASGHYGATLFIEPETREGRALTERYKGQGIAEAGRAQVIEVLPALLDAVVQRRGRAVIVEQARRIVHLLTQHTEPATTSDERISRAVRYINDHLSAPITLADVARVACLSPSRFRHLFAEQTGMGLRQYVLWRRFVSVWEHRMNGASLSTAAHAAGFADSAHLTRTGRRMMGIPPSLLDISA
ncbi:MAG TPA: AraC family transcriptional regulator [Steroidobacteraceae bacterium]|jgi:AraC family transcriptional regulator|nr:AraC family transcriptional regulator [Steroidobacteraceae bacterium]